MVATFGTHDAIYILLSNDLVELELVQMFWSSCNPRTLIPAHLAVSPTHLATMCHISTQLLFKICRPFNQNLKEDRQRGKFKEKEIHAIWSSEGFHSSGLIRPEADISATKRPDGIEPQDLWKNSYSYTGSRRRAYTS